MAHEQRDDEQRPRTTTDAGIPAASDEFSLTAGADGPILLQNSDDLPFLARPMDAAERAAVAALGAKYGQTEIEDNAPVTFIGSGPNLNDAAEQTAQVLAQDHEPQPTSPSLTARKSAFPT